MSGGLIMKLWLSVLAILLPLGVMAAPAAHGSLSISDLDAQWKAMPVMGSSFDQPLVPALFPRGAEPFLLASEGAADKPGKSIGGPEEEVDLREVDWDKLKAGKKGEADKTEVGNGGEAGEGGEEGEEDEVELNKEGGEEEGEGGWDRLWDAPKLG
jgi:hypothetical protein